jgi:hypothetical protein
MKTTLLLGLLSALGSACGSGSGGSGSQDAAKETGSEAAADVAQDTGLVCNHDLPTDCVKPVPSYKTDVTPILRDNCAPCHYPGGIESYNPALVFDSYVNVDNADTAMQGQLYACEMPPVMGIPKLGVQPAPPLPEKDRETLLDWLRCGAPDN